MTPKRNLHSAALLMILALIVLPTGSALAGSLAPLTGAPDFTPSPPPATGGAGQYLLQQGDTLGGIALLYDTTVSNLLALNPQITDPSAVQAGQIINVPASTTLFLPTSLTPTPTPIYPTLTPSVDYRNLMVTYGRGLLVRTGPGIENPEIKSRYVSAVKFSHWQYRKNSVTTDNIGFIWVEVKLSPLVSGYSTGWILVRDSLGMYFTSPQIGPKIIPGDP